MSTQTDHELPADSAPETDAAVTASPDARIDRTEQGPAARPALLPSLLSLLAAGALAAIALALVPHLCSSLLEDVPGAQPDWTLSWRMRGTTVAQVIQTRWQPTTLLVGAGLGLAYLLALIAAGVAVLIHRLEQAVAPLGALLKALGRLALYPQATLPVYVLGVMLILFSMRSCSSRCWSWWRSCVCSGSRAELSRGPACFSSSAWHSCRGPAARWKRCWRDSAAPSAPLPAQRLRSA